MSPASGIAAGPASAADEEVGLLAKPGSDAAVVDDTVVQPSSFCGCFSVAFYRPYFDVDTNQVSARLRKAMWPMSPETFNDVVGNKPDLYGPTWICLTLVFVIGVTSNMSSWSAVSSLEVRTG